MKKVLLFTAKLSFSVLFGFLLLEIALRVYNPFSFTVKGDRIVLPANKTYVFENKVNRRLDPVIEVKKNSLGFRGPELPADFDRRLTVVAVGGSTTFCDMLTEGKTWTDRLFFLLRKDFPGLWLNNAGLTGHSTVGHLTLMKEYLIPLKPKVLLFLVGINDIETEHAWIYDENILQWRFDFYSFKAFTQSLARNIEVLSVAINLYRAHLAKKRNLVYFDLDLTTRPQVEMSPGEREAVFDANWRNGVPAYRRRIEELHALCRENGIVPIFVTQPALYGHGKDDVTGVDLGKVKVDTNRNGGFMWDLLEVYNDQLRELSREGRIDVIDLAGRLPKSSRYFSDFYHFTNEGAEEVSKLLYPEIKAVVLGMQKGESAS